jgi:hypothetical protein
MSTVLEVMLESANDLGTSDDDDDDEDFVDGTEQVKALLFLFKSELNACKCRKNFSIIFLQ